MGRKKNQNHKTTSRFARLQQRLAKYKKKVADIETLIDSKQDYQPGQPVFVDEEVFSERKIAINNIQAYVSYVCSSPNVIVVFLPRLDRHIIVRPEHLTPDLDSDLVELKDSGIGFNTPRYYGYYAKMPSWNFEFAESFLRVKMIREFPFTKEFLVEFETSTITRYSNVVSAKELLQAPERIEDPEHLPLFTRVLARRPEYPGYWVGAYVGREGGKFAICPTNPALENELFYVKGKDLFQDYQ